MRPVTFLGLRAGGGPGWTPRVRGTRRIPFMVDHFPLAVAGPWNPARAQLPFPRDSMQGR